METTLNPNTPHFPPAPTRVLSVMVENLQLLAARAHGLHVSSAANDERWADFQPSTRSAMTEAMRKKGGLV